LGKSKKPNRPRPPAPGAPAAPPATRRPLAPWIAGGVALVAVVAIAALWSRRQPPFALEASRDANVLLVTIDTLRADALSAYGGAAKTPNLDRLAAHGARFTFAHAHAVVTLPSHTTILTGHLPYEHGMRDNSGFRVKPGTDTLATRLKSLGFATGAFVGGFPVTKRFGLTPGFDVYDDQMPELKGAVQVSMPERRGDIVVSRAVDWIGKQNARWFAWVHVFDPHSPYKPPAEYASQYQAQPYLGEVAFVDHALGSLFDKLAALPKPTVVVVTADHGESLGEHGELTHGMFAYEPTLHVPLIIARIEGAAGGTRGVVIDAPVRHIDIAPTVLEVIGAAADRSLPGSSLGDLIRSGSGADRPVYFESMTYNLVRGWAPLRGVLSNREKYIDLPIPELYDLANDPNEEKNAATEQADRRQVLFNMLRTYNVAPANRPGAETPETAAALRSLGYISGSAPPRETYTEKDDPKRLVEIDRDLHTATRLTEDGKQQEAIGVLKSVIARRPDTADAYLSLAYAYWEAGQPEPAIATLEGALKQGAPERDVRIRLGLYLAESHTDAKRAITLLEGMSSEDVEALNGLGVAYGDAGRYDDALKTFNKVLALDPTNGLAFQNLSSITLRQALDTKDATRRGALLQSAESYARKSLEADPMLPDAHTTLGVILSTAGRRADAIESWKRAVDLDPGQFNALYNLWSELAAANRRDEALTYGRQFVATAPPAFFKADIERIKSWLERG
jgi:tetratricopeptide (TPR) repeat protein